MASITECTISARKMSSHPNDPRRLDRVKPYKAAAGVQSTSGGEDFLPDYMNILGMIFSMCGLMMKLKWCGEFNAHFNNDILKNTQ